MSLLDHAHAHTDQHAAVERLVRDADLEIIPLKSASGTLPLVPEGTIITVTVSAKMGLARTLDFTDLAARAGYRVVPHIAARLVPDLASLRSFVGRLDALGVTDLYVVGGDAPEPVGDYNSAVGLLEALSGIDHGIRSIGVAGYPEGHPSISETTLHEALRLAQPHADYMVSQLCFNDTAISGWLGKLRAEGITLPLHLGIAAPMQMRKLAELSIRIGVGSSVRYLTKQHGFLGNALRGASYRPEKLLYELGDTLTSADAGIERLHVFTFNQLEATLAWQRDVSARAVRA